MPDIIGQELARYAYPRFGTTILNQNRRIIAPEVPAQYNASQAGNVDEPLAKCELVSLYRRCVAANHNPADAAGSETIAGQPCINPGLHDSSQLGMLPDLGG